MDSNQWLAYLTGALALATFLLAYQTWSMAKVARRSLALEERPYLAFTRFQGVPGAPGKLEFRPILTFENKGPVLIHFKVDAFDVTANRLVPSDPTLKATEGVAFPGVPVEYEGPKVSGVDVKQYWTGQVHFKLIYWYLPNGDKFIAEDHLDVSGDNSKPWVRWLRSKAPNYT
jgi:hypothetical protein